MAFLQMLKLLWMVDECNQWICKALEMMLKNFVPEVRSFVAVLYLVWAEQAQQVSSGCDG